jgi:hypothetical protein
MLYNTKSNNSIWVTETIEIHNETNIEKLKFNIPPKEIKMLLILCTHNSGKCLVFKMLLNNLHKIGIKYVLPVIKYSFIVFIIGPVKENNWSLFDNLMNEYLITGKTYLKPILCKLFNNILNTRHFPELWVQSIIIPVFILICYTLTL